MSEEVEVTTANNSDDDFWETYQEFYLNGDAVEVSEPYVLIERVDSCYHNHNSTPPQTAICIADCSHELISDITWTTSVFADDCSHNLESDEVKVTPFIEADDASHELISSNVTVWGKGIIYAHSTHHDHVSDEVSAFDIFFTVSPNNTEHVLDTGKPVLTPVIWLDVEDTHHDTYADGDLYLAVDGEVVAWPNNCGHTLVSDEVGTFTEIELIKGINDAVHQHYADEVGTIDIVYTVPADNTHHDHIAGFVTPEVFKVDSAEHYHIADIVGGWVDSTVHTSADTFENVIPRPIVASTVHNFANTALMELGIIINPDDCFHYHFTPTWVPPDNCVHNVRSSEPIGNVKYRRFYV